MQPSEVTELFDQLAPHYDQQWQKMAPIRSTTELMMDAILAQVPTNANILCVGAGTGSEIIHMAQANAQWRFTVVEPSTAMMDVCLQRLTSLNLDHRCDFHTGYIESLETEKPFNAATAILVSQFISNPSQRSAFFQAISDRLTSDGVLISCDLCANLSSPQDQDLLEKWFRVMQTADMGGDDIEKMRALYAKDLAIVEEQELHNLIINSGFEQATLFLQACLIKGWYSYKTAH